MRLLTLAVVLAGCGGTDADSSPTRGTRREPESITRLDLPHCDDGNRVVVLANARPAALVWVGATGKLAVGKVGKTWSIDSKDRADADIGDLRQRVLLAVVASAGPGADDAARTLAEENDPDPNRRARRAAIDQARRAGILGTPDPNVPGRGRLPTSEGAPLPRLDGKSPLVVAAPSAPAAVLARVLRRTGGALAVDHEGQLAVLDAAFAIEDVASPGGASWLELYADARGLHLVLEPDEREKLVEWRGTGIDTAELANAYTTLGNHLHVDVLVRDDTTAQTLVDMLAALAVAGVTGVGVAEGPTNPSDRRGQIAAARRDAPPSAFVAPGQPNAQGDLDKALIRAGVHAKLPEIRACYEKQLLAQPHLAGTVMVQFFIAPNGKVATASAAGVDPEVASCVATTIKQIEFPAPAGGGGVQVNYPFTFRS